MQSIHFSKAVLEPWAILPESLSVIVEIVSRHFSGEKLDTEEVQMRIHGAKRPEQRVLGRVAVLPLFGMIFPRANLFTEISGATSAEIFGKQFEKLIDDPTIGAIVLDVDSPGGQVPGIEELSTKIFQARGIKPIYAVANYTMASAAYWIGTAADQVIVSPSGEVGSIGVLAIHEDQSQALEQQGLKISLISEGKYKTTGNPYEPLNDEARSVIQAHVSEIYGQFINAVARNRGVKPAAVRNGFGDGDMVGASKAVDLGMADRIATMDEVIAELQSRGAGEAVLMGYDQAPMVIASELREREEVAMGDERIVPSGNHEDDFTIRESQDTAPLPSGAMEVDVSGEAREAKPVAEDAKEEADATAESEEVRDLRNYVLIFGPAQSGRKDGEE